MVGREGIEPSTNGLRGSQRVIPCVFNQALATLAIVNSCLTMAHLRHSRVRCGTNPFRASRLLSIGQAIGSSDAIRNAQHRARMRPLDIFVARVARQSHDRVPRNRDSTCLNLVSRYAPGVGSRISEQGRRIPPVLLFLGRGASLEVANYGQDSRRGIAADYFKSNDGG
jgi:hypothetical protein